jgi:hypothetical protein
LNFIKQARECFKSLKVELLEKELICKGESSFFWREFLKRERNYCLKTCLVSTSGLLKKKFTCWSIVSSSIRMTGSGRFYISIVMRIFSSRLRSGDGISAPLPFPQPLIFVFGSVVAHWSRQMVADGVCRFIGCNVANIINWAPVAGGASFFLCAFWIRFRVGMFFWFWLLRLVHK